MSDFLLRSMDWKHAYPLHITKDKKQWDKNKCWYVHCSNDIHVVHLARTGTATHGYCWWCYRDAMLFGCLYGNTTKGKWVTVEKNYKTKKPYLKENHAYEEFDNILRKKYSQTPKEKGK